MTSTEPAEPAEVTSAGRSTRGSEPLPDMARSLGALLAERVAKTPDREAFRGPDGDGWQSWTWAQTGDWVHDVAAGLLDLGLEPEQRVAIAAGTSVEWIVVDLAVMCAGGATTTIYPSTNADDVAYILADSGSRVAVVADAGQLVKVAEHKGELADLEKVVVIDGEGVDLGPERPDWLLTLDELVLAGRALRAQRPGAVEDSVAAVGPDSLATLIYTSGTTGRPKGVELTHRNWCYEAAAIDGVQVLREHHVQFLWLPLSHSFGKVLVSGQLQVGFSSAVDGRVDKIVDNLAVIKPSFMAGAPRIFEKVYARVVSTTSAEGGIKAKIFDWAIGVGKDVAARQAAGKGVPALLGAQHRVADALVFSKIRARMGGNVEYFVSGSAALSHEVAEWFAAIGIPVLEGYGLTETSAATMVGRPGRNRVGTVGQPLPGSEARIAADGELLVRGPGVMRAYHNLPEATAEVMLADGWLATGDIATIDDEGRVSITDRKKDLIKTSGGKYIAPSLIESRLKALCPLLANVVVHAEGRNYATALVTIDPDTTEAFAQAEGIEGGPEAWPKDPKVEANVRAALVELNATLNRWETVKDVRILPRDLTVEDGELTPSLKIKRRMVEIRYAAELDSMYQARKAN
ncbi:MAG TPA: long-chain fatty acid--CoA ligase [Candidatus Nanopelagicales bacterium]|nr:long-chain fatty acid--CoA ligase [Candidatus Nanopelagicales bacterium]